MFIIADKTRFLPSSDLHVGEKVIRAVESAGTVLDFPAITEETKKNTLSEEFKYTPLTLTCKRNRKTDSHCNTTLISFYFEGTVHPK